MSDAPIATLLVPDDHPVLAGHFPGMPLVPGVMLLDWVLREASAMLGVSPHALRIREAKFFNPLRPGERAGLFLKPGSARLSFHIARDDQPLASGVLERV